MESTSVWKRIFGSSKNIMMLAAVIVGWAGYLGFNLPIELVIATFAIVGIAIVGRAAEDVAKVNASAAKVSSPSIGMLVQEAGKAVEPDGSGAPFPTGLPGPGERDS